MVFSSLVFICIFLPVTWLLHTVIGNGKARNGLLLAASLLFYACGEPVYVLLMLASALWNYLFGLAVGRRKSCLLLAAAVVLNIGVLCFFKYTAFAVESLNAAFSLAIPVPQVTMPIGISFFTFQALSYVIDVYRGQTEVQRSYPRLLLYISFFPQLIAGPIVRYRDIAAEIDSRTVTAEGSAMGMRRFIFGLAKKVLIANTMAEVVDAVFAGTQLNVLSAWLGAIAYLMQIYFDFCGYSDMAIGLGQLFGFHFNENFNLPYTAVSVQDFWRRWHISLSSWFRDYVYIPLGGNRKGKLRTVLNRLIVFFLTGLWHGANWTFVVWGLYHGCFLLLEAYIPKLDRIPRALRRLLTLLAVTVGFVIFRADSLTQAWSYLGLMFTGFDFSSAAMSFTLRQLTPWFIAMLAAAIAFSGPLQALYGRLSARIAGGKAAPAVELLSFAAAALLLAWCILRLSAGGYNPFIYFRF